MILKFVVVLHLYSHFNLYTLIYGNFNKSNNELHSRSNNPYYMSK